MRKSERMCEQGRMRERYESRRERDESERGLERESEKRECVSEEEWGGYTWEREGGRERGEQKLLYMI